MVTLAEVQIKEEVTKVVKEICSKLKIDVVVDADFCPGEYIKSQILLTFIGSIADALSVTIPNDSYIFSDKNQKQLSIKETAQKILKVAKHGK